VQNSRYSQRSAAVALWRFRAPPSFTVQLLKPTCPPTPTFSRGAACTSASRNASAGAQALCLCACAHAIRWTSAGQWRGRFRAMWTYRFYAVHATDSVDFMDARDAIFGTDDTDRVSSFRDGRLRSVSLRDITNDVSQGSQVRVCLRLCVPARIQKHGAPTFGCSAERSLWAGRDGAWRTLHSCRLSAPSIHLSLPEQENIEEKSHVRLEERAQSITLCAVHSGVRVNSRMVFCSCSQVFKKRSESPGS
jgi:hypothetical protein